MLVAREEKDATRTSPDIMKQLQREILLSSQLILDDKEVWVDFSCDDMGAVTEDKKPAALPDVKHHARAMTPVIANGVHALKARMEDLNIEATLAKYAKHDGA